MECELEDFERISALLRENDVTGGPLAAEAMNRLLETAEAGDDPFLFHTRSSSITTGGRRSRSG